MKKIIVCSDHLDNDGIVVGSGPTLILKGYQYKPILDNNLFPICIPPYLLSDKQYEELIKDSVGVIFFGGKDINPIIYGEDIQAQIKRYIIRDTIEFAVFNAANKLGKNIFGICRGLQLINVALGGTLYQDLQIQTKTKQLHMQNVERDTHCLSHKVFITKNSFLYKILNQKEFYTNTFHHQSVKDLGKGLQISAVSNDGIIEAIQHKSKKIFAVQWHPEIYTNQSIDSQKIINRIFTKFFA